MVPAHLTFTSRIRSCWVFFVSKVKDCIARPASGGRKSARVCGQVPIGPGTLSAVLQKREERAEASRGTRPKYWMNCWLAVVEGMQSSSKIADDNMETVRFLLHRQRWRRQVGIETEQNGDSSVDQEAEERLKARIGRGSTRSRRGRLIRCDR